jgi:hypothetical protein
MSAPDAYICPVCGINLSRVSPAVKNAPAFTEK